MVAAACPSIEIYGLDHWEGSQLRLSPIGYTNMLKQINYMGYLRLISGNIETSLERLRDSFIGPFTFDLVLLRGSLFKENAFECISKVIPHLSTDGAIIYIGLGIGEFRNTWSLTQEKYPQYNYFQRKGGAVGMIMAGPLLSNQMEDRSDCEGKSHVDFGNHLDLLLPNRVIQFCRRLKSYRKYPYYIKQLCLLLIAKPRKCVYYCKYLFRFFMPQ